MHGASAALHGFLCQQLLSTVRSVCAEDFPIPKRKGAEEVPVLMSSDGGGWGFAPSSSYPQSG
eukprot:scaffold160311_cov22-Prasinocladus_malaysianus.AAC.1